MGSTNYNFKLMENIWNTIARQVNTSNNTAIEQIDVQIKVVEDQVGLFVTGINQFASCKMATTGNIILSGLQAIDGIIGSIDDRILVWQQTDQKENGPYLMKSGAWVRTTDADSSADFNEKSYVYVNKGTVYHDQGFAITSDSDIILGTSNIIFQSFPVAGSIGTSALNMNSDLPMNSHKITLLSNGTLSTDAVNKGQMDAADALKANKAGDIFTGDIVMGANKVTSTANPATTDTLTRRGYIEANFLDKGGGVMSGAIDMGTNGIINLGDPFDPQDAATKNYVDTAASVFNGGTVTNDITLDNSDLNIKSADDSAGESKVLSPEIGLPSGQQFGGRGIFTKAGAVAQGGTNSVITNTTYTLTDIPKYAKWVWCIFSEDGNTAGYGTGTFVDFIISIQKPVGGGEQIVANRFVQPDTGLANSIWFVAWVPVIGVSGGNPQIKINNFTAKDSLGQETRKYIQTIGYSIL